MLKLYNDILYNTMQNNILTKNRNTEITGSPVHIIYSAEYSEVIKSYKLVNNNNKNNNNNVLFNNSDDNDNNNVLLLFDTNNNLLFIINNNNNLFLFTKYCLLVAG